jgi:2-phospho-L-lactate/phosphoenolpyruvate guanylyltransferase
MILVPVKNTQNAKQRLASLLEPSERTELAQAMLQDVFETLDSWENRPAVAVVTSDPFAREMARRLQFEVIADEANHGETEAIEMATRNCVARSVENTLVIPADIPLLQVWELERILESAPAEGSVLVPSADGHGTNAAFRRPADLFPLRFGNNSFDPHLAAAKSSERACVVLSLPGIALDVDTPADLRELIATPGDSHAQRLARRWDLSDLPLAANE